MPATTESSICPSLWTVFFKVFAIVFLLVFGAAAVITFALPDIYAATARVKVENDGSTAPGQREVYDPFFVQTTFEIMRSDFVLSNVVSQLGLNTRWGKKYYGGRRLSSQEAVKRLGKRLEFTANRNTKLVEITAYSDDAHEAAEIANAVAESYQNYRLDLRRNLMAGGLKALEQQVEKSSAEIQAAQSNVEILRASLHIEDNDPNSDPTPTLSEQQLQTYNLQMIEGERVYNQLQTQFEQLQLLDKARLREILPTVVADNMLADLTGRLRNDEKEYANMTNQYEPGDEQLIHIQSELSELNGQIDGRMTAIMAGLESEVKSKKAALDSLTVSVEQAKIRDQEEQERGQPYWEAKRKLVRLQDFHKILAAKIEEEKVELEIPKDSLVQIVDRAEPADRPVRPNRPLDLFVGAVIAVLVGSIAGGLSVRRVGRLNSRAQVAPGGMP